MSDIFCMRCKSKTATIDPKAVQTTNGKYRLKGKCVVCGTMKSKFISKQEGEGLLSMLGIKTPLANIPIIGDILF